ncbi:MAG: FtsW/RodA/SpoVE family cell cycle protein [Lachnospiraceae bacterium]|jgi:rod shape determining protein RodA|nr:FtsW/RodA/SpoVE family cell cycle protein [Lachnospiraceae bacterium]MBR2532679.1 FtsW/RodA/SpoVE family cell cycle protein [Lachnospiraceae bacterium]
MKSKYSIKAHSLFLLAVVTALNFLGILILRSASNMDAAIVSRQIIGSLTGFAVCLVISFMDYNRLVRYNFLIYMGVVIMLAAVAVWGAVHKGAGRWIVLPVVGQIQPAEFVKAGLILYFGGFFGKNRDRISEPGTLFLAILLFAIPALLVFIEPNLSTTIILTVIFAVMLVVSGLSVSWILLFAALAAAAAGLLVFLFTTDNYQLIPFIQGYQKNRILSFLYPEQYSDTFFQQANSIMAIGSGGFFGKGLYNTDIGSVKAGNFLIEEDTDFIFAIIGEELGFRGCLAILLLYVALILVILWIAVKSKNLAGAVICAGVAAWIGFQTFTNIAVATALFPNTGVTLPFFSRGASSLLSLYIGIGMVSNIGLQTKEL